MFGSWFESMRKRSFYVNKTKSNINQSSLMLFKNVNLDSYESESENELEDNEHGDKDFDLIQTAGDVIRKLRKCVKLFRKSLTRNDILQKCIKKDHGTESLLKIDVYTRWGNLIEMISSFIKVYP
ncbi:hypothetical protein A3Q56_03952 [Intoshia linei]|uniref:Uncharacterized protein n=1 Tax=Intoshia linei TaxID=1819745 RepID=A0A177B246_9BILA|nr:hypothetical protein A3Q56_03952 [Intoshia linei]